MNKIKMIERMIRKNQIIIENFDLFKLVEEEMVERLL
jgi:hypothetical protein